MQAELPDKNTAFIVYRRESISSWKSGRYDACIGALYSLMGLLPTTYRPTISTEEFDEVTHQDTLAFCTECETESNYSTAKTFEIMLPLLSNMISGQTTEKVWECSNCKKLNSINTTKFTQKILKEPFFIKVIPQPPNRESGILGRTQFTIKFSSWFWLALSSIEAQMGRYREEYQPKDTDMFDLDSQIPASGESDG